MFPSEIKYGPRLRVFLCYVSSQDDSHPADALGAQDRLSSGWVSSKHAPYPQELGFRFDGIVTVDTLRILANETKISSCIDIYVAEPTLQEEQGAVCCPYSKAVFRRLGYVHFSNNAASDHQARELKTVALHRRCTYLKLSFRNPHVNEFNIFQQVGVAAIVMHGKLQLKMREWAATPLAIQVGEQVVAPLDEMMPLAANDSAATSPARIPGRLAARLEELTLMKRKAVEVEDFDTAEVLKQQIFAIEKGEREIARLEVEKQRAVSVENYKMAKEIKQRIEALRMANDAAAGAAPGTVPYATNIFASPPSFPTSKDGISGVIDHRGSPTRGQNEMGVTEPPVPTTVHDEMVVGGKGFYDLSDATGGLKETGASQNGARGEREVPVTGDGGEWELTLNKTIQNVSSVQVGPSPLSGDAAATASQYVKDLGVYCVACLFSRKGQQREAALRGAASREGSQALASHSSTAWGQLVLYMGLKGYGVGDPVAGAAIAACDTLIKIVQGKLPSASISTVTESVHKILPELVLRIGESNTRVQESVERAVVALARTSYGHRLVAALLMVDPDKQNKKPASVRTHVSRINILSTFVDDFGLSCKAPDGLETRALCTSVLLPCLQHSSAEVRDAAVKLFAKLLFLDSSTTRKYVEGIKPVQQALVEEHLEQYKQSQSAGQSAAQPSPEMQTDTMTLQRRRGSSNRTSAPSQPQRASLGKKEDSSAEDVDANFPPNPPLQRAPASIGEAEDRRLRTCQFCGEYKASFNEHNLDLHYVSACPMLCPCPLCEQVTEICQLQQHLVTECEQRRQVRECPRCREAVRVPVFNEHVAGKKCIEAVATQSVCPLCHQRFKAGMNGWRHHLASSPGCPNNPRRFDGSGHAM